MLGLLPHGGEFEETDMNFSQRTRGMVRAFAVVLSLAVPLAMAISSADARVGGGGSSGSRGSRTFSAPPSTTPTAPGTAQPMNRTFTQPGSPGMGTAAAAGGDAAKGGFFNRPGLLGGLAAGFLGAGLLGMLFGGGMFSGLGGLSSIFGLILDIGLILIVVKAGLCRGGSAATRPAAAFAGVTPDTDRLRRTQFPLRNGLWSGIGGERAAEIQAADYEAFERLLGEVQAAWSNEDVAKLHTLATPEMVSYFTKDLEANKASNDINKTSDVRCLPQGDLAEAWREGETDYASVAMRFSLVDKTLERGGPVLPHRQQATPR